MSFRFHPTLAWPARFELAVRLGWVWATVPRLPAPPEPQGVVPGRLPAFTVIGIGDSITAGIGVTTQSESLVAQVAMQLARGGREVRWQNAGVSGATAAMLECQLERPVPRAPDLLLLSCGVNDVVRGHPAADLGASLAGFHRKARARWPETVIVHAGIPPLEAFPALHGRLGRVLGAHGITCIAAARSAANEAGARYLDFPRDVDAGQFAHDGFHPNAAGCAVWAATVACAIVDSGILPMDDARVASD